MAWLGWLTDFGAVSDDTCYFSYIYSANQDGVEQAFDWKIEVRKRAGRVTFPNELRDCTGAGACGCGCGSVRERAGAGACGIVRERAGAMYHKVGFVVSLRAARCRVTGFGGWRVHRDCASRSRIEIAHRDYASSRRCASVGVGVGGGRVTGFGGWRASKSRIEIAHRDCASSRRGVPSGPGGGVVRPASLTAAGV